MRYIIESAALHAKILNRTLVIPSFTYARACEHDKYAFILHNVSCPIEHLRVLPSSVCADYFPMINRIEATGLSEWRILPPPKQMGFRVPISVMLNVTLLRQYTPVILLSDYLRLHNLSAEDEQPTGTWHHEGYHFSANVKTGRMPSLFTIKNSWFDPIGTIRVDDLPRGLKERGRWNFEAGDGETGPFGHWNTLAESLAGPLDECLHLAASERNRVWLEWSEAREIVGNCGPSSVSVESGDLSDKMLESVAVSSGWEVVHTFRGL